MDTLGKFSSWDTLREDVSLDKLGNLVEKAFLDILEKAILNILEDATVILDADKATRLIATLASILIMIVIDITSHFENLTPANITSRIIPIPLAIVGPSAVGNDVGNYLTNVLGNPFSNCNRDAFSVDLGTPVLDLSAPLLIDFFAFCLKSSDYHKNPFYAW